MSDEPSQTASTDSDSTLYLGRLPLHRGKTAQPKDVDDLPAELLEMVHDRSVLGESVPYLDRAVASTNAVDSYFTRMRPSSLANYAEDAKLGLAILSSHNSRTLPMGRTYDGKHIGGGKSRTEMDFYLPRGINVNGVNNDDVITAIRWGSVNDVSIGFKPGQINCSIDGKEMFKDWRAFWGTDPEAEHVDPAIGCYHIPGVDYPQRDAKGKKLDGDRVVCIGDVEDGHCHELSLVYAGATPGAEMSGRRSIAMDRALQMDEAGVLPAHAALLLQDRFAGVRFKAAEHRYYVPAPPAAVVAEAAVAADSERTITPEETSMTKTDAERAVEAEAAAAAAVVAAPETPEPERTEPEAVDPAVAAEADAAARAVVALDPDAPEERDENGLLVGHLVDPFGPIRAALVESRLVAEDWGTEADLSAACEAIRAAGRTLTAERTAADFGRAARAAVVADLEKEAVRANGASWPRTAYRAVFENGTYEELAELRDTFRSEANRRLGGSRVLVEREAPKVPSSAPTAKPDAAYSTR